MKINIEIEVTNCTDCLYKKSYYGQGECFTYCDNKNAPKGYENILWGCGSYFTKIPKWCPLNLSN